jgi:beta-phosphoglucomutase-like phosphatase (HAD superfamily)
LIKALIFDMDGTMIDSMGHHRLSWIEFARRHALDVEVDELMRRTTGRTGAECMADLFGRAFDERECWALIAEKEQIYRELFAPEFREVAGFRGFAAQAHAQGFKLGVGTAGDRHNIAFAMQHLAMEPAPQAIVGGDEGLPGKPEPAIFLEVARRLGVAPARCVVFEDAPRRHGRGGGVQQPRSRRTGRPARAGRDRPLQWRGGGRRSRDPDNDDGDFPCCVKALPRSSAARITPRRRSGSATSS